MKEKYPSDFTWRIQSWTEGKYNHEHKPEMLKCFQKDILAK